MLEAIEVLPRLRLHLKSVPNILCCYCLSSSQLYVCAPTYLLSSFLLIQMLGLPLFFFTSVLVVCKSQRLLTVQVGQSTQCPGTRSGHVMCMTKVASTTRIIYQDSPSKPPELNSNSHSD